MYTPTPRTVGQPNGHLLGEHLPKYSNQQKTALKVFYESNPTSDESVSMNYTVRIQSVHSSSWLFNNNNINIRPPPNSARKYILTKEDDEVDNDESIDTIDKDKFEWKYDDPSNGLRC